MEAKSSRIRDARGEGREARSEGDRSASGSELSGPRTSDLGRRIAGPRPSDLGPRIRYFRYSLRFILPSSHTTIDATVSLPWIVEMSKHSMRRGIEGRFRMA